MEEENQPKPILEENKEQEDHEMTDENHVILELQPTNENGQINFDGIRAERLVSEQSIDENAEVLKTLSHPVLTKQYRSESMTIANQLRPTLYRSKLNRSESLYIPP